jgi:hypothetical protein
LVVTWLAWTAAAAPFSCTLDPPGANSAKLTLPVPLEKTVLGEIDHEYEKSTTSARAWPPTRRAATARMQLVECLECIGFLSSIAKVSRSFVIPRTPGSYFSRAADVNAP